MEISSWMFDAGIIVVLLVSGLVGAHRGIGDTAIKLIGLVAGLFLGYTFTGSFADWLAGTPVNDMIHDKLLESMNAKSASATSWVPGFLQDTATSITQRANEALANQYTAAIIKVAAFLIIVLVIWLIALMLRRIFKLGRKKNGIVGGVDRGAGFALGLIKGIIISCLLVALVPVVTTVVAPLKLPTVVSALKKSFLAGKIYDANPILIFLKKLIGM